MTEPEVLEKLNKFKDKLIAFRDERDSAKAELEIVKSQLLEKSQLIDSLTQERTDSVNELNTIHESLNKLQNLYELKNQSYNDLKKKTYQTVKHLVEDNIEVKEVEIDRLNNRIAELESVVNKNDIQNNDILQEKCKDIEILKSNISDLENKLSTSTSEYNDLKIELDNLNNSIEQDYIKKDVHQIEIEKILEDKAKSDEEKQTVLSNTWKTQIQTSKELRDVTQKLEITENLLSQEKEDNESLKVSLNNKITEFENYKLSTDEKLKEYEQDVKKIDTNTQLEISRLTEKVKGLTTVREELELKNSQLVEKIKNLELALQKNSVQVDESPKTNNVQERSVISKETIPYKFGSTTATVMQKAKNFVDELYKDSIEMNNVYILGNPKIAAENVGLTDKEYTVFMNRFSECLEYNGVPLLYQQGGEWKSNLSKIKLIDFISTVSGK
jgi:chromosome segregation ATPase